MRSIARVFGVALAFVVLTLPSVARSNFSMIPVSVVLTPQKPTNLITVHNTADHPVRMQLNVYSWDQTPDGKLKLAPTDDVVFYPPILSVEANADSIVRVGAAVPFSVVEKTYRVIAEEMPPPPEPLKPGQTNVTPKVLVLSKLSIPVFLQATQIVHSDSLDEVSLRDGILSFRVKNQGNTHLNIVPASVDVLDGAGKPIFQGIVGKAGYVLPNEYRDYAFNIPNPQCRQSRKLKVQISVSKMKSEYDSQLGTLKAEFDPTPDMCGTGVGSLPTR
jgi:fimbrial chaperone protein